MPCMPDMVRMLGGYSMAEYTTLKETTYSEKRIVSMKTNQSLPQLLDICLIQIYQMSFHHHNL